MRIKFAKSSMTSSGMRQRTPRRPATALTGSPRRWRSWPRTTRRCRSPKSTGASSCGSPALSRGSGTPRPWEPRPGLLPFADGAAATWSRQTRRLGHWTGQRTGRKWSIKVALMHLAERLHKRQEHEARLLGAENALIQAGWKQWLEDTPDSRQRTGLRIRYGIVTAPRVNDSGGCHGRNKGAKRPSGMGGVRPRPHSFTSYF